MHRVQPLGLTFKDMIDQATVNALNAEVRAILAAGEHQMYAEDAIRQVADAHGFVFVESTDTSDTDGGLVELCRNEDGAYTTIWFVSQFGQASDICDAEDYDHSAIGFDDQELGWGEVDDDE